MPDIVPSPLLRRALLADALGSLPVAALHLMATAPLAAAMQLAAALLGASGAVMAAYVASLLVMAGRSVAFATRPGGIGHGDEPCRTRVPIPSRSATSSCAMASPVSPVP